MAVRPLNAPRRRIVFGVNVLLQVVLALALAVALIWFTGWFNLQGDLTGSGSNSLSARTVQLLKGLDQNIRITAVFAEPDKRDELGAKRRRQLQDLLALYDSAGGARVSADLLDPSLNKKDTDALLARLQELPAYKDEARPHREALARFGPLNERIQQLAAAESARAEELAAADPQVGRNRNFAIIRTNLREIARNAEEVPAKIQELEGGEVPRYGQAVRELREYVTNVESLLREMAGWMGGEGLGLAASTPELKSFFESAQERYEPVLADVRTLLDETKDLKDVKLEELYTNLTRWPTSPPVLVENEREARVVSFWDLWPMPTDPDAPVGPDGDNRVFAGEAAVSSAILQLTQTEKTAVVFVRFGGESLLTPDFKNMNPMMMRQMPRAPLQELNQMLEKANFVTAEWNVQESKTPPEVENAKRRIWVVIPPEPQQQQDFRQPPPPGLSPEDRKAVLDAVEQSGTAIFLAGWQPPTSPMPGSAGKYEFADYLKTTWGIDVKYNYLTLHFSGHPEKKGLWIPASRRPELITTDDVVEFTSQPIASPLRTERAGFVLTAPLEIATGSLPAGVQVDAIATVRKSSDIWAASDIASIEDQLKRNQGVRPSETTDLPSPFPIAVAATNDKGQRVVVFGSVQFIFDQIAQATGLMAKGGGFVLGPMYPANTDLLVNALHWLTNETTRIAVGPRAGAIPRLHKLDQAWADRLPWLVVGVWPAVALLAGLGVWLVRRK